jgi:hypothetical protein
VSDGFAPIAVGLTVGFCALMGGPLTGASMNPARSLGPAVMGGGWHAHWLYWAAPITGMLGAVQAYDFLGAAHAHPSADIRLGAQGALGEPPGRPCARQPSSEADAAQTSADTSAG